MTQAWSVRPALASEAAALAQIDTLGSPYPWSSHQFQASCQSANGSEQALVAEVSASIAGFVVYSTTLDEGDILNLVVLPRERRKGVARGLVLAAQQAMLHSGVKRCLLEVRVSNVGAINLYSSMGFAVDGERKNYYRSADGREGALLMSMPL